MKENKLSREEYLIIDNYERLIREALSPAHRRRVLRSFLKKIKSLLTAIPKDASWEKSQITMEEAKTMIVSLSNEIARLKKPIPEEKLDEFVEDKKGEFMNIYHLGRPNYRRELNKLLPKTLKAYDTLREEE